MKKLILIVDDVAAIRSALKSYFENQDGLHVCGEAEDGLEAIKKARDLKPDLIILDFAMPLMNGIQAAAVLHREMPAVPLILFTMHAGAVVESTARLAGISIVISKAEEPTALVRSVRTLLRAPAARHRAQGT